MNPRKGILRTIAGKAKSENQARFLGIACMLTGLFVVVVGTWWIAETYFSARSQGYFPLVQLVLFGVPLLCWFASALIAFDLFILARQRMYDLQAEQIWSSIKSVNSRIPNYILYLRPFDSTGRILFTEHQEVMLASGNSRRESRRFELEMQFAESVRDFCAFVALGKSLEHEGAGRIEIDDSEWQNTIRELMSNARLIVMIPVTNAGTLWELDQIIERDWVSKTLFVNVVEQDQFWSGPKFQQSDDWPAIQLKLQQAGYSLPEFSRRGRMIFFRSRTQKPLVRRLNLGSLGHLRRMIKATRTLKK